MDNNILELKYKDLVMEPITSENNHFDFIFLKDSSPFSGTIIINNRINDEIYKGNFILSLSKGVVYIKFSAKFNIIAQNPIIPTITTNVNNTINIELDKFISHFVNNIVSISPKLY